MTKNTQGGTARVRCFPANSAIRRFAPRPMRNRKCQLLVQLWNCNNRVWKCWVRLCIKKSLVGISCVSFSPLYVCDLNKIVSRHLDNLACASENGDSPKVQSTFPSVLGLVVKVRDDNKCKVQYRREIPQQQHTRVR